MTVKRFLFVLFGDRMEVIFGSFKIFAEAWTVQAGSIRQRDPSHTGLLAGRIHRTPPQFRFAAGCPPCTINRPALTGPIAVATGLW